MSFDSDRLRETDRGRSRRASGRSTTRFEFPNLASRARLGVTVQELTPELAEYFGASDGLLVSSVMADSPASRSGVKAGDVITSVDGRSVASAGDLAREAARLLERRRGGPRYRARQETEHDQRKDRDARGSACAATASGASNSNPGIAVSRLTIDCGLLTVDCLCGGDSVGRRFGRRFDRRRGASREAS